MNLELFCKLHHRWWPVQSRFVIICLELSDVAQLFRHSFTCIVVHETRQHAAVEMYHTDAILVPGAHGRADFDY